MTDIIELAASHPLDICECGDYRQDHVSNGPCTFNGGGFDMCHGGRDCMSFRLHERARAWATRRAKYGERGHYGSYTR